MSIVVGVSFRKSGRVYFFDPNNYKLSEGDRVIVETIRGLEMGKVIFTNKEINLSFMEDELKKIVRPATDEDLISLYQKKILSRRALKICKNKIKEYNLDMKLIDVEYAFDDSKIIFYFSADGRIDFRNLVKELALIFKKRIELHQIGVRDEAKILGAVGLCGRPVCCNLFMPEFVPVSIKMAKEQNLSLNPERISGVCGRFMCCLKHEHEVYYEGLEKYPPIDSFVNTEKGKLKVVEQCISKDSVICETLEQERIEIPLKKIPEYAHVVEAKTTPDNITSKIDDGINIKETSVKEANILAREAINLLSGIGNIISSDDIDNNENLNQIEENKISEEKENKETKKIEINKIEVPQKDEVPQKVEVVTPPAKKEKFKILIPKEMIKSNILNSDNSPKVTNDKPKKASKIKISSNISKEIFAGSWNGSSSSLIDSNINNKIEEKQNDKVLQEEFSKSDIVFEDNCENKNDKEIKDDIVLEDNCENKNDKEIKDNIVLEDNCENKNDKEIKDNIVLENNCENKNDKEIKDDIVLEDNCENKNDKEIKDDIVLEDNCENKNDKEIKDDIILEDKENHNNLEALPESKTESKFEQKFKPRSEKKGFQPRNPFLMRKQKNNHNDYKNKRNNNKYKNENKRENNDRYDKKDRNEQHNDKKFSKQKKFWLKGNNRNNNNNKREDS